MKIVMSVVALVAGIWLLDAYVTAEPTIPRELPARDSKPATATKSSQPVRRIDIRFVPDTDPMQAKPFECFVSFYRYGRHIPENVRHIHETNAVEFYEALEFELDLFGNVDGTRDRVRVNLDATPWPGEVALRRIKQLIADVCPGSEFREYSTKADWQRP